ncbi:TetR/AcrR family transcriptional regulator [Natronoglycomyces albus]|uniref:TetR family transcriptional regulator n=1 Tax=Natronoglycomyces albus TaxID=2811108 RepID=A0A895XT21_9ACTN|nr:TetR/AcrR family transcriptional regulator [Natronoglycomyces albus]QSB05686.1 TetR family transcriptional regulator [Natronoglycomyces albus]
MSSTAVASQETVAQESLTREALAEDALSADSAKESADLPRRKRLMKETISEAKTAGSEPASPAQPSLPRARSAETTSGPAATHQTTQPPSQPKTQRRPKITRHTETVTSVGALRRLPVQERSAARVSRMLDAAASLVEEVGYDRLSTTAIAQRADVAIGSVYQFFGDKRSLTEALSQRYIDQYLDRLAMRLEAHHISTWHDGTLAAVDEYIHMYRTAPGFRVLHLADVIDPGRGTTMTTGGDLIAEQVIATVAELVGSKVDPWVTEAVTVALETGQALVRRAFRRDPEGDDEALSEARRMVSEYLRDRVR